MTPGICTECSGPIQKDLTSSLCLVCLATRFGGPVARRLMEEAIEQDKKDAEAWKAQAAASAAAEADRWRAQDEARRAVPQTETQKG